MKTLHRETNARVWERIFFEKAAEADRLNWDDPYKLSEEERQRITKSIQMFQIGEYAEGRNFMRAARRYAEQTGDDPYLDALALFIKEEQRHSFLLGRVMEKLEIPLIEQHWVDETFRWLRRLAGLELCIIVLVTAELIAKAYYNALRRATDSPLLQALCRQILRDEAHHIWFQGNTLRKLRQGRSGYLLLPIECFQYLLMAAACLVVWREHRSVLRAGGLSFFGFIRFSFKQLRQLHRVARLPLQRKPRRRHAAGETQIRKAQLIG